LQQKKGKGIWKHPVLRVGPGSGKKRNKVRSIGQARN